jgi:hypothetical protein
MGYISQGDLVANMTPEQKILVQQFYAKFDNGGAVNKKIVNVEPFFFEGTLTGSGIETYVATKLYLCLQLDFTFSAAPNLLLTELTIHSELNAIIGAISPNVVVWDTTAVAMKFHSANVIQKNFYFSRLGQNVGPNYIRLNGYLITLI